MKNVTENYFQDHFNFQRIICEKEFKEVRMMILRYFDSFGITYFFT